MSRIDLRGTGGGGGNVNAGGTLTNHQLVVGRGSTNVAVIPPLNDGQLAIGSTGIDPVPATLTAGANITITNAPGSITIASTGGGGGAPSLPLNSVQYDNAGAFGGAAHTNIDASGQINVDTGFSYRYNGTANALFGVPNVAGDNFFEGAAGNFTVTGDSNFGTGTNALASLTTGFENLGVGVRAGANITTGSGNVCLGRSALGTATAATQCIAIGQSSMAAATGGNQNIGIGQGSVGNCTSGANNVAVGVSALGAITTGTTNVAIGGSSLAAATSDSNNTAVGHVALQHANGGAGNNTAIGHSSLIALTTGPNNTAIGQAAVATLTTGQDNTGVGWAALLSSTADNCTAIGALAALNNSSGGSNTYLGYNCGASITTGSNNLIVGDSSDVPSASANGQMSIKNYIYGTGLTGTGSTISTGKIGIGIKAPTASLHIQNSTTAQANIRLDPTGAAGPSSPNDGDFWYDGTHLDFRHGGITTDLLAGAPASMIIGTSTVTGSTANDVLYGDGTLLQQAAQFQITSGQPDVRAGHAYLYDGNNAITAQPSNNNWFFGNAGTLGASGINNIAINGALGSLTTGQGNIGMGVACLQVLTTGSGNIAMGLLSAFKLTTESNNICIASAEFATGVSSCMFIGGGSGNGATGGVNHIGLGSGTLANVAGGSNNLAIGTQAMGGGTALGGNNSALGANALFALTSGVNNSAEGATALQSCTTGSNNSGQGSGALAHLTTGNANFALGPSALGGLIDGSNNVAIGNSALVSSQHDDANCAIGNTALATCNGGLRNTAIGNNAGGNLTTGSQNIIIGPNVSARTQVTSGSGNVMIGVDQEIQSATASNQLNISNFIYGTGMSGIGNTISPGAIGIGIKAPAVELDVAGTIQSTNTNHLKIDGLNNLVSSDGTECVLQQTGDTFGATSIRMRNRFAQNGALFQNSGLDLAEFIMQGSSGAQGNYRFEHRPGNLFDPANTSGELQKLIGSQIVAVFGFAAGSICSINMGCAQTGLNVVLQPYQAGQTIFLNTGLGLVDTIYQPASGAKNHIRFEGRAGSVQLSGNATNGEYEITVGGFNMRAVIGDAAHAFYNSAGAIVLDWNNANANQWTLHQTNLANFNVALTNGAAATSPTLGANGPAGATTPTKWVPINDNGTTRYIPAW